MRDDRYDHTHPQHRDLMLPCYPACQGRTPERFEDSELAKREYPNVVQAAPPLYPVGTVRYHNDGGRRLVVTQRWDDQVVLSTVEGHDYCRATVAEVTAFTHGKRRKASRTLEGK